MMREFGGYGKLIASNQANHEVTKGRTRMGLVELNMLCWKLWEGNGTRGRKVNKRRTEKRGHGRGLRGSGEECQKRRKSC
jgi:hypothetical protein